MKAVVTGGGGFVGRAVIKELLENGFEVICIDKKINPSFFPANNQLTFMECSIEDLSKKKTGIEGVDLFYHFAWKGSAGPLRNDPEVQVENAKWTIDCLKLAKEIGCPKFICAGSIMEFETQKAIYAQGTKPAMSYIYGAGKTLAHELAKPLANSLGIDLIWAYITNAYGVGEESPRFINTTLKKIISKDKLNFTAGNQCYDFIYIDDVAKAFYLLGKNGIPNKGYVIGSGRARALKDFIIEMIAATDPSQKPTFGDVPFTGIDLPLENFDITPLRKDCGFNPKISFADGIQRTFQWLKGKE